MKKKIESFSFTIPYEGSLLCNTCNAMGPQFLRPEHYEKYRLVYDRPGANQDPDPDQAKPN